jgi:replicative DNA helicase
MSKDGSSPIRVSEPYDLLKRSREAEAGVLGGIMLRGFEAIDIAAARLVPEDFGTPKFEAVFRAMLLLFGRGEPIDVITLETQLRRTGELELVGGIEGLAVLDRYVNAHNVDIYVGLVLQGSQMRRQLAWHLAQAEAIKRREELADEGEWEEFNTRGRQEYAALTSTGARGVTLRSSSEVVESFMSDLEARAYGRVAVASLGIPEVDDAVSPQQGDVAVLMGRPGMGKTAASLSMTLGLTMEPTRDGWWKIRANASPVLWASAEMPAEKLIGRLASNIATLEGRLITRPDRASFDEMRQRLIAGCRLIDDAPITFVPDADAKNLDRIVAAARKWRASLPVHVPEQQMSLGADETDGAGVVPAGVPVLFIDYIQILTIPGTFGREDLKYAHAAKVLAALAIELSIVIVVCAQLLKAVAGRDQARPRLGDIKEASGLEDAAHHVISIYRPAVATSKLAGLLETMKRLGRQAASLARNGRLLSGAEQEELQATEDAIAEAYLDVLKARNGELGPLPASFDGRYTRVSMPTEGAA